MSCSNIMTYKGHRAQIAYDDADRIFTGRLTGLPDIVVFHGQNVEALQLAMQESVDGYLAACGKLDQQAQHAQNGQRPNIVNLLSLPAAADIDFALELERPQDLPRPLDLS